MLAKTEKSNLEQVRSALTGITGVEPIACQTPADRHYMVVCRPNREFDTVDSFRRHGQPAFWPNYEELVTTRERRNGHPVRRTRRVGIIAGYVFTPVRAERDFTAFLARIIGAIGLVKTFSGSPLVLDDDDIQTLRRIEATRDTSLPLPTQHAFKLGEKVRFKDDNGHRWPPGRIVRLARQGRIVVEVSLMGRKVELKALPHQIERS